MSIKTDLIKAYFEVWEHDITRAELLLNSEEYYLEGLIVIVCYIGALGNLRYRNAKDWEIYRDILSEYSGHEDIFDNIDLLLFYQFKSTKLTEERVYRKLENYDHILEIFINILGGETNIRKVENRYVKKEDLSSLIRLEDTEWFDEENFLDYIRLFSNNQIFYKYARCEAVHNADFPLVNRSFNPETNITTYSDNHQVDRNVMINSLQNIVINLKNECISSEGWPWEL